MHKALIIDDERLARNELKKLLQEIMFSFVMSVLS